MSQQPPPAICLHQGLGLFNHYWISLILIGTSDMILGFLPVRIRPCHIQPCCIRQCHNWPFLFESFNLKTPYCKFLSQVFHLKTTKQNFFEFDWILRCDCLYLTVCIWPCCVRRCHIWQCHIQPFISESFDLKTLFHKFLSEVFHLKTMLSHLFEFDKNLRYDYSDLTIRILPCHICPCHMQQCPIWPFMSESCDLKTLFRKFWSFPS